jgi:CRISPR/Cas system-associated protein Cas5 (RAMP superfamily)
MTPLSVLSLAPDSKQNLDSFVYYFTEELEAGRLDPLKVMMLMKGFEKAFEGIKEVIKKEAIVEVEKYGKGSHQYGNFVFSVAEAGTKYNFESTGDPVWKRLKKELEERQEMLKTLSGYVSVVDTDTGEEVKVCRAAKTSTTTVKLELR